MMHFSNTTSIHTATSDTSPGPPTPLGPNPNNDLFLRKSCTSRLINLFDSLKKREYKPNKKKINKKLKKKEPKWFTI